MAIIERTYGKETNAVIDELLISFGFSRHRARGSLAKTTAKSFSGPRPRFWRAKTQRHARRRSGQEQTRRRDGRRRRQRRGALSNPWIEVSEPRRSRAGSRLAARFITIGSSTTAAPRPNG